MLLHQKLFSTSKKGDTRRIIIIKKYLVLKQGQFVYVCMYMYDLYYVYWYCMLLRRHSLSCGRILHHSGIHTGFFRRGGGECEHRPVVLSQTLLCVVEMCSFFIKCINEKTKQLSSERMMLCITKS